MLRAEISEMVPKSLPASLPSHIFFSPSSFFEGFSCVNACSRHASDSVRTHSGKAHRPLTMIHWKVSRYTPMCIKILVAPYCAIPRDYLTDTPHIARYGVFGWVRHPPPFLSVSPLESMLSGGAIPPLKRACLSDTGAIPYENKANRCYTPLCDTISKGYCAIGGVSRTGPLRSRFFRHYALLAAIPLINAYHTNVYHDNILSKLLSFGWMVFWGGCFLLPVKAGFMDFVVFNVFLAREGKQAVQTEKKRRATA